MSSDPVIPEFTNRELNDEHISVTLLPETERIARGLGGTEAVHGDQPGAPDFGSKSIYHGPYGGGAKKC